MFTWHHKHFIEADIPLQQVWQFTVNPSNMSKWNDQFESFHCEEELKSGSIIKGKIKNKDTYISLLITELDPPNKYDGLVKVPLFTQKQSLFLQEISTHNHHHVC